MEAVSYLLDTNILLELLLEQTQADAVEKLLRELPSAQMRLTDFSLFSVGIVLFREGALAAYTGCLNDLFIGGKVQIVRLAPADLAGLPQVAEQFQLDFDDAYQYLAATKFNLEIVSFDADFDRTPTGRKLPQQLCP